MSESRTAGSLQQLWCNIVNCLFGKYHSFLVQTFIAVIRLYWLFIPRSNVYCSYTTLSTSVCPLTTLSQNKITKETKKIFTCILKKINIDKNVPLNAFKPLALTKIFILAPISQKPFRTPTYPPHLRPSPPLHATEICSQFSPHFLGHKNISDL